MLQKTFLETEEGLRGRVTFSLPACIWADQIHVVGDFNDWNRTSHPLQRSRDGSWRITVDLEPGKEYQFRYIIDGEQWINDCRADAYVPNGHGSHNSVVTIHPPVDFSFDEELFEPEYAYVPTTDV